MALLRGLLGGRLLGLDRESRDARLAHEIDRFSHASVCDRAIGVDHRAHFVVRSETHAHRREQLRVVQRLVLDEELTRAIEACGRSTGIDCETMYFAVTIKMINSTRAMSTKGVTLIPEISSWPSL